MAVMNVSALRRRYLGLALLTLIGVGMCLPLLSVSAQADDAAKAKVQEGNALRSIEILPRRETPGGAALTLSQLERVRSVSSVSEVEPTMQATFGIKTSDIPGALLHGTKLRPSLSPPVRKSVRPDVFPLKEGEVLLPGTVQGMDLTELLGKTVDVSYQRTIGASSGTGAHDRVLVVGTYDPSWQLEGADAAFVSDSQLIRWASSVAAVPEGRLLETVGYDKATVLTSSSSHVSDVLKRLQAMGFTATSLEQQFTELPSVLRLIHAVSRVFVVVITAFLVLASSALSSSLVRQRTREIGLLKSVGYTSRSIIRMFLLELGTIGLVFTFLGIAGGAVLGSVAAGILAGNPDLTPYVNARQGPSWEVLAVLILLPTVAVVVGGLRSSVRGALLEPSVALRDW
jgi:putative ABC transport system permease protein